MDESEAIPGEPNGVAEDDESLRELDVTELDVALLDWSLTVGLCESLLSRVTETLARDKYGEAAWAEKLTEFLDRYGGERLIRRRRNGKHGQTGMGWDVLGQLWQSPEFLRRVSSHPLKLNWQGGISGTMLKLGKGIFSSRTYLSCPSDAPSRADALDGLHDLRELLEVLVPMLSKCALLKRFHEDASAALGRTEELLSRAEKAEKGSVELDTLTLHRLVMVLVVRELAAAAPAVRAAVRRRLLPGSGDLQGAPRVGRDPGSLLRYLLACLAEPSKQAHLGSRLIREAARSLLEARGLRAAHVQLLAKALETLRCPEDSAAVWISANVRNAAAAAGFVMGAFAGDSQACRDSAERVGAWLHLIKELPRDQATHKVPSKPWPRTPGRVQWLPSRPLEDRLAGREEVVDGCVERLCCDETPGSKAELDNRRVMICGRPGVGKTAAAAEILSQVARRRLGERCVWLRAQTPEGLQLGLLRFARCAVPSVLREDRLKEALAKLRAWMVRVDTATLVVDLGNSSCSSTTTTDNTEAVLCLLDEALPPPVGRVLVSCPSPRPTAGAAETNNTTTKSSSEGQEAAATLRWPGALELEPLDAESLSEVVRSRFPASCSSISGFLSELLEEEGNAERLQSFLMDRGSRGGCGLPLAADLLGGLLSARATDQGLLAPDATDPDQVEARLRLLPSTLEDVQEQQQQQQHDLGREASDRGVKALVRLCLLRVLELRDEAVRGVALGLLRVCCAVDGPGGIPWSLLLRATTTSREEAAAAAAAAAEAFGHGEEDKSEGNRASYADEAPEALLVDALEAAAGLVTVCASTRTVTMQGCVQRCLRSELPASCPPGLLGTLLWLFGGGMPAKTELQEVHEWLPSALAFLSGAEAAAGLDEKEEPPVLLPGELEAGWMSPVEEALIRSSVALVLQDLGMPSQAEQHAERALALRQKALGGRHPETLSGLSVLAAVRQGAGRLEEALPVGREVLRLRQEELGARHDDTLGSLEALAGLCRRLGRHEEAQELFLEALGAREAALGESNPRTLACVGSLAGVLEAEGKHAEAEPLQKRVLEGRRKELRDGHPSTLAAMSSLAATYIRLGRSEEAEPLLKEALAGRRKELGDRHPNTLASVNNLAGLLLRTGSLREAERLFSEALDARREVLGDSHPDTLVSFNNLAGLYKRQGRLQEAEPLYQKALAGREAELGAASGPALTSLDRMVELYEKQGKYSEAEPLAREAAERRRRELGPQNHVTLGSLETLSRLLEKLGRLSEAEGLLLEVLEARVSAVGDEHDDALAAMDRLAAVHAKSGNHIEAERLYRHGCRVQAGETHAASMARLEALAELYLSLGRASEAEPLLSALVESRKAELGAEHRDTLRILRRLGGLLVRQGRCDEAEKTLSEAARGYRKTMGQSHLETISVFRELGAACEAQGSFDKAEQFFREAIHLMKLTDDESRAGPERHPEEQAALDALVGLLLTQGRFDDAEKLYLAT